MVIPHSFKDHSGDKSLLSHFRIEQFHNNSNSKKRAILQKTSLFLNLFVFGCFLFSLWFFLFFLRASRKRRCLTSFPLVFLTNFINLPSLSLNWDFFAPPKTGSVFFLQHGFSHPFYRFSGLKVFHPNLLACKACVCSLALRVGGPHVRACRCVCGLGQSWLAGGEGEWFVREFPFLFVV